MPPRQHVSPAAVELIKRFEGFRAAAARLPDGRWTIGYGHTRTAREGVRISEADAGALLLYDLGEVSVVLNTVVFTPLTQNQFDALASFAMNIGVEEFRHSEVLLRLNEGALLRAAAAIEHWRRAEFEGEDLVVDALVRRRSAEKALFLKPDAGYVPTPTPVVRPRFDPASDVIAPAEAVRLTASLEGEAASVVRSGADAAPVEAAGASRNARLQAILDDLDLGTAPPQTEPASAPPIVSPLPDPYAKARRGEAPAAAAAAEPAPEAPEEDAVEPFHMARFDPERLERTPSSYLPLGLMLVVGVVLLATATYWFVHAHPGLGGVAPSVIGWVMGLTGVGLLAGSIYFLLERIGSDNQD